MVIFLYSVKKYMDENVDKNPLKTNIVCSDNCYLRRISVKSCVLNTFYVTYKIVPLFCPSVGNIKQQKALKMERPMY